MTKFVSTLYSKRTTQTLKAFMIQLDFMFCNGIRYNLREAFLFVLRNLNLQLNHASKNCYVTLS